MTVAHPPNRVPMLAARWIARVLSLAVFGIIAAFAFGEGTPRPKEWILLAFFPIGLLVGLAVAWWREIPGALLTIGAMVGFYVACYASSGKLPSGPYFALLASPAAFFLLAGVLARGGESPRSLC